jgi:hypothetical protein
MGKPFSEKQICDFLTEYTENDKLSLLYKQPPKPPKFDVSEKETTALVNYKKKVKGTNLEQYNYIAKWLIDHNIKELFENNDKLKITRNNTYIRKEHENIDNSKDLLINDPNQREELMAKNLYLRKELDYLGKIIDYQTPIQNTDYDKEVGAVDLLAYNEKDKMLSIIELKNNKNDFDTLLRAILEICTYYYQLDREKLIKDFKLPVIEPIRKIVLIYNNSVLHKQYSKYIKDLAETLKVNIFTMEYSESNVIIKEVI